MVYREERNLGSGQPHPRLTRAHRPRALSFALSLSTPSLPSIFLATLFHLDVRQPRHR